MKCRIRSNLVTGFKPCLLDSRARKAARDTLAATLFLFLQKGLVPLVGPTLIRRQLIQVGEVLGDKSQRVFPASALILSV